jgi:LPXTG-motif cell wall-anchored protein
MVARSPSRHLVGYATSVAQPRLARRRFRADIDSLPKNGQEHSMRIVLNVASILCVLMGCVWFLQGINVLPGSFMTGQTKWAVYGGLLLIAGIALLILVNRRRVDSSTGHDA